MAAIFPARKPRETISTNNPVISRPLLIRSTDNLAMRPFGRPREAPEPRGYTPVAFNGSATSSDSVFPPRSLDGAPRIPR